MAELDWLLENITTTVEGIRYAAILSPDGLTLGRSPGVTDEVADRLAALASALHALARGAGQQFDQGDVDRTVVEMEAALLFVVPVGRGTSIALLADSTADAEQVAYEMAVLIKRVGQHMIAGPRPSAQAPAQAPAAR